MLAEKIKTNQGGILLYGITPPKQQTAPERVTEIARLQLNRIQKLSLDGLLLYDIQPETERTDSERPFPFLQTIDPATYAGTYLQELELPKIIYRAVAKYDTTSFADELKKADYDLSVFVGAASANQKTALSIAQAYDICKQTSPELLLGGVTIPERHRVKRDEHKRLVQKTESGCSFFVSQAVYNTGAAKDLLSDYYYHCQANNLKPKPIIFTYTPCGSAKTLEFMKWLGISIPRWLENDLLHSVAMLDDSVEFCRQSFSDLWSFARQKKMPIGCNVESVSVRKEEIQASVDLVAMIKDIMPSS